MKRYRITNFDFDSRANILNQKLNSDVDSEIKEMWRKNKESVIQSLIVEFGELNFNNKIKNFTDLKGTPVSIVAFHNKFLKQIRSSFTMGDYYPALTGACGLGERILNHLIICLRDDFKSTDEYKKVYNKNSFDDWDFTIKILESWKILLPNAVKSFQELKKVRHTLAMHFNPITDEKDREIALQAIELLSEIIREQFGALGAQPWFIPSTRGAFYIKKEAEEDPFIKKIYLPNAILVGAYYKMETIRTRDGIGMKVVDNYDYKDEKITDEEFVNMLENKDNKKV